MREIKFRAWDMKWKKMFHNGVFKEALDGLRKVAMLFAPQLPIGESGLYLPLEDGNMIFMQYTGIKDKNGKEIYEGDILSWSNYNNVEFVGVVTEKPGVTYIDWKKPTEYPSYIFEAGVGKMEVIGNVWEDGDLLK